MIEDLKLYQKIYRKEWREKNRESIRKYMKKHREAMKEHYRNYNKDYWKKKSQNLEWKKKNNLRQNNYSKNYYKNHPEWRKKRILYVQQWREKNPEKYKKYNESVREKSYSKSLMRKYGITINKYNKILEKQNGVCAICKKPTSRKLFVDHNHTTGNIRGLLCISCNSGIGYYELYKDKYEEYLKLF